MTIVDLKMLQTAGKFHHATYRQDGLWTGLWVYEKAADGFRGYKPAGAFFKDDPALPDAEALVRGSGISLGAYGHG